MAKRVLKENRMDIVVQAFLTHATVTDVSEATGIPRTTIYSLMRKPEFQEKMSEARRGAMDKAVTYMQGNLSECAEVLMDIVRDKKNSPQVRINAINTIFQNCRGSSSTAGTVTIIDSL